MKKVLKIGYPLFLPWFIVLISLMFLVQPSSATRYMHSTGAVQLRVDDTYPAGFLEFNYIPFDSQDVLWVAFMAITFAGWSEPFFGRASDVDYLYSSSFMQLNPLDLDTIVSAGSTDTTFSSFYSFYEPGFISVFQNVFSKRNNDPFVKIRWIIRNDMSSALSGGIFLFHFEGDVPVSDYENDMAIEVSGHLSACQRASPTNASCAGFIWLKGGLEHSLENTQNWYYRTVGAVDASPLKTLMYGEFWSGSEYCDSAGTCPIFVDSLFGDVGIGIIVALPNIAPSAAETLEFLLAAAPYPDSFFSIVRNADTASVFEHSKIIPRDLSIEISPNPFNSACEIFAPGAEYVLILDVSGKLVSHIELDMGQAVWKPAESVGTGIYFIEAFGKNSKSSSRALFIK